MTRFAIRDDYVENGVPVTLDSVSQRAYWNKERIWSSSLYQYPVYRYLISVLRRRNANSVLDVGCGVATKLEAVHEKLPNVQIRGVDQPAAMEFCRLHRRFGSWYDDDFEKPQRHPIASDVVISSDVIEHLVDPDVLLEYIKQHLLPGGWVVLSTPERDRLRGPSLLSCPNKHHIREWNFDELESYLSSRGFRLLEHRLMLPVKLAPNRLFLDQVVLRALRGRPVRYSQVCLLAVA